MSIIKYNSVWRKNQIHLDSKICESIYYDTRNLKFSFKDKEDEDLYQYEAFVNGMSVDSKGNYSSWENIRIICCDVIVLQAYQRMVSYLLRGRYSLTEWAVARFHRNMETPKVGTYSFHEIINQNDQIKIS